MSSDDPLFVRSRIRARGVSDYTFLKQEKKKEVQDQSSTYAGRQSLFARDDFELVQTPSAELIGGLQNMLIRKINRSVGC